MRRYAALFQLMVRSTIYKLLAVMAVMGAAQVGLFAFQAQKIWSHAQVMADGVDVTAYYPYGIADVVNNASLQTVWFWGVIIFCEILVFMAGRGSLYTLDRLGLSRRGRNLLYSLYHTMALVVLFAFQAAVAVGLCLIYSKMVDAANVGPQTIFLAFYRVPLFHSVLPLGDWFRWLFNLVVLVCLGIATAEGGQMVRNGRRPVAATVLAALTGAVSNLGLVGFSGVLGLVMVGMLLFVGGVIGPAMFRRDRAREEEADDEAETTA